MSRRARVGLSPSLFPFLAVLVCTLGTLILLLALVAQNASTKAERDAAAQAAAAQLAAQDNDDAESKPTREVVDRLIQEGEFRVAQLVSFRDSQTTDVGERRDQITHIEDHIRRVREELARLSREVELATSDEAPQPADEQRVTELKSKLASERESLVVLRETAKARKPRVVIVPHKGPNGTDRRPVYLECTASGITIWPESSRIELAELLATDKSANPVDAALRTVRLYAMQNYGDTIPPYPLLVVRPDGIETYIAAKAAMQDWDDQFGYELVPYEVDLAFAKSDSQLKEKVDLAIREAISNQRVRIELVGGGGGRGNGNGGGGATAGSGTGQSGNSAGRVRTLSAAALDRDGRSGGFSDTRDRSLRNSNYGSSPNYGSSNTGDASAARRLDEHLQNAAADMAGNNPAGLQAPGATGLDGGTPGNGTAVAGAGSADQPGTGQSSGMSSDSLAKSLSPKTPGASESVGGFKLPPSPGEPGTVPATSGQPGLGQSASGQPATNDSDKTKQEDSSQGGYASGSAQGSGDGGKQAQGGGAAQASSSAAAGQASSSRGSADESQQGAPSTTVTNSPPSKSVRKMLQRKGNDWALPENVAGINGTAVVRTIRVVCYSDRLVLLAPASGGATEMFGFSDGEIDRATLELAAAVRDRIETWGPSLPGGRWQPRLDVEVKPDGSDRFEQLQTLMKGSGVEVFGRPSP